MRVRINSQLIDAVLVKLHTDNKQQITVCFTNTQLKKLKIADEDEITILFMIDNRIVLTHNFRLHNNKNKKCIIFTSLLTELFRQYESAIVFNLQNNIIFKLLTANEVKKIQSKSV